MKHRSGMQRKAFSNQVNTLNVAFYPCKSIHDLAADFSDFCS